MKPKETSHDCDELDGNEETITTFTTDQTEDQFVTQETFSTSTGLDGNGYGNLTPTVPTESFPDQETSLNSSGLNASGILTSTVPTKHYDGKFPLVMHNIL